MTIAVRLPLPLSLFSPKTQRQVVLMLMLSCLHANNFVKLLDRLLRGHAVVLIDVPIDPKMLASHYQIQVQDILKRTSPPMDS